MCLMARGNQVDKGNPGARFFEVLNAAAKLPGIRVDRESYLRAALRRHCTQEQIDRAIAQTPAAAGIPFEVITEVANTSVTYETRKVTGISALAGIPGGIAMFGTIPADFAQYVGHMLRVAQKLAYIYSWPDLFGRGDEEMDEATKSILTLFVGVMFGINVAQDAVARVSAAIAVNVAKKLPQRALTKGVVYPVVKKVAGYLGVSMTKRTFASGVAKAVPVLGAVLSGGLTLGTFLPMSKRLQKHLASLELTKPGLRPAEEEIIGADDEIIMSDAAGDAAEE